MDRIINDAPISCIQNALLQFNLKLTNIYKHENAIYSCFAQAIYGDVSHANDMKQECKKFTTTNKSFIDFIKRHESNIEVNIQTAHSKSYSFNISKEITIKQFRDKIRDTLTTLEPLKLIHAGKILRDETIIKSLETKRDNSMIVMLKCKKNQKRIPTATIIRFNKCGSMLNDAQITVHALSRLYNVKTEIYKYQKDTKQLIITHTYGDHKQSAHLPLILFHKQSHDVYGVLIYTKHVQKSPMKSEHFRNNVIHAENDKKRKLDMDKDDIPHKKRRKISFDDEIINFDSVALNEKYMKLQTLHEGKLNQLKIKNEAMKQQIKHIMDDNKTEIDELKQNILKLDNELEECEEEKKRGIKQVDELQKKLKLLENNQAMFKYEDTALNTLNLDELQNMKAMYHCKIKQIEEAEKELIDNKYKCVACMDRSRNIAFTDGCSHIAYCDECEALTENKACPICQAPYQC